MNQRSQGPIKVPMTIPYFGPGEYSANLAQLETYDLSIERSRSAEWRVLKVKRLLYAGPKTFQQLQNTSRLGEHTLSDCLATLYDRGLARRVNGTWLIL